LLLENMSKRGIDVNSIEIVVLSHIHGDHTGGLEMFLKKNPKANVYLAKSFPKRFVTFYPFEAISSANFGNLPVLMYIFNAFLTVSTGLRPRV